MTMDSPWIKVDGIRFVSL